MEMLQEGLALLPITVPTPVYPQPSSKPATGGLSVSVEAAISRRLLQTPLSGLSSLWNIRGSP